MMISPDRCGYRSRVTAPDHQDGTGQRDGGVAQEHGEPGPRTELTAAAIDHLHCLRMAMRGPEPNSVAVHIQAPFSLARGALENASTAMWLMVPPGRQERIRRRLRYEMASVKTWSRSWKRVGCQNGTARRSVGIASFAWLVRLASTNEN